MMNLDEAIKHCEEVADTPCFTDEEAKCYSEHQQLAEWLKELKAYKEQSGDAISRKYILDLIDTKGANLDDDLLIVEQWIQDAPSVNLHPIECGDAISRREALNAITMAEVRWQAVDNVNKLPSVTPQQKAGRWILADKQNEEDVANDNYRFICSECQCSDIHAKGATVSYCWNCGVKMEVKK